jgi:hypothetical protein
MDARHPKSGLPDFGTKIAEIGSSRFRLLAAILRDARILRQAQERAPQDEVRIVSDSRTRVTR